ncbi:MAG: hypothetical protein WCC36_18510 [Gammaproteobacteria bacterium]
MIRRLLKSDLVANRYYAFGLAVQKGTPFLVVPLVIWAFGAQAYANYVLTFAAAQLVAMAMSLGTTNSLVVFWYRYEDKNKYLRSLLLLIGALGITIGLAVFGLLITTSILPRQVIPHLLWAGLIVVYAAIYNWNVVGLSLIRVTERSRQYFLAVVLTSITLLVLIVAISRVAQGSVVLVAIYMGVLALQSMLFMVVVPTRISEPGLVAEYRKFMRQIFGYSIPVVGYTLVSLSVFTIDKWVIKGSYTNSEFTQYVLNFQFAFAANIVSVVLGMYLLPTFCRLVESQDLEVLGRKVQSHYALSVLGTIVVGTGMYGYGRITGVHLTEAFWILVGAFGIANLFTVNVNVLEAFRNSRALARIAVFPTVIFWLAFVLSAGSHALLWNYSLFVAYYAALFWASYVTVKRQGVPMPLALKQA